ncbi:DUF3105 domain-containing protein [Actinomarinicola tropica]|uniref:DUF3105 domain-containing protein n=1 Tax=Actinomarinicola tropica TaxID=2789776 RepID=A0A5Q2RIG4_9ACTN|nr:DUF3105 domain-containing protein [Actinomarinicola tropica]QGG94166.1 DUF3105 domain-containing protein [Actinomarinicola tropica]
MSPHPQSKKAKAAKAKRAKARTTQEPDKPASMHEARLERQIEQRRHQARKGRLRRIRNTALGVVALGVVAGGGWLAFRPDPELAGVARPSNRGGGHVAAADYDSPTPTSGAHDARAPRCGTYREPLNPAMAVHGLEHGAVVLWYDAARPELADELIDATDEWDTHVIISANTGIDRPVVATAWGRIKAYDAADPEITEFVRTYRQRGPERLTCDR